MKIKLPATRNFGEMNQSMVGAVGLVLTLLVTAIALNVSNLRAYFYEKHTVAQFADANGLHVGDDVREYGLKVGVVRSISLNGTHVDVSFTTSGVTIGDLTSASIKTANPLGRKFVAIVPAGSGSVASIPESRTTTGYSVSQELGEVARNVGELDLAQLATSLESVTTVLQQSPEAFRSALSGVSALSDVIASRDSDLNALLQRASSLSAVLAQRNQQILSIVNGGSLLLGELEARRQAVSELLTEVTDVSRQISGFVGDNQASLKPALTRLDNVAKVLVHYRGALSYAVENFASYATGLGDAVGSGPFFQAYLQNITEPTSFLPTMTSAMGGK